MSPVRIVTAICPECDEGFRLIEVPLPITRTCPHCMKKIKVIEVVHHEEEN
jgi:hypothetical protein